MRGQVRMLGALQVAIEDRPVKIASPRERVVFAGLAIRAGETASHDQLCRALWGEDWSRKRDGAYRPAVSRLRKTLGTDGLVVRESFGYRLDIDPGDVDLLVMGQSHHHGFFQYLGRSSTQKAVEEIKCVMMIVPTR